MSLNSSLFTSLSQVWETPKNLYNILDNIFHFNYDLAASKENTKHSNFFSIENSALESSWKDVHTGFLNPPFSLQDDFINKAYKEYLQNNVTTVALIPSRTETKRWQNIIFPHSRHIIFLKGRLKFSETNNSAPFPSAIIVFSNNTYDLTPLIELGFIVR